jgi:hypothetical protein
MTVPSIKGLAIVSIVDDVKRLVQEGRISEAQLEAALEPADLRILGQAVQASQWYPTASYARLGALLDEVEGGGRADYFVGRGARAAERLFAAGVYSQLERVDRRAAEREGGSPLTGHDIRVTLSLWKAMFNFTAWDYAADPENPRAFTVQVTSADEFPEVLRLAAQGFLEYGFSRLAKAPIAVTSARPDRDRIVYSFREGGEPASTD